MVARSSRNLRRLRARLVVLGWAGDQGPEAIGTFLGGGKKRRVMINGADATVMISKMKPCLLVSPGMASVS